LRARHSWAVISPDFGGEAAGDVVAVFGGHQAHSLLFGDAAGGNIGDGFGSAQDWKVEGVEPKIGTAWQASSLDLGVCQGRQSQKPRLSFSFLRRFDAAMILIGSGFEAESPVPGFAAFDDG